MDLTKYKNHVHRMKQCIVNVELAQMAYMSAIEMCSYGMQGAQERLKEAKENLESAERTLKSRARINDLLSQEASNVS